MKNISLVLFAIILTLTFTASDVVVEKGNKPDEAKKCPYFESLQQNGAQMQCPYLERMNKENSACPYLNQNSDTQTGCPYLDGGSNGECPYLKHKDKETIKVIETHPLPPGRNT
jgi:hypothetical protein